MKKNKTLSFFSKPETLNPGASADGHGQREFARAITNHLLLSTFVTFLIVPSALFLSAIRVTFV